MLWAQWTVLVLHAIAILGYAIGSCVYADSPSANKLTIKSLQGLVRNTIGVALLYCAGTFSGIFP